jgi:hypothetical protein
MKHLTEEELIANYYGEEPDGNTSPDTMAAHLRACRECGARYSELQQSLERLRPEPVPTRAANYGEQVWQRLSPALPPHQPRQPRWRNWFHLRILIVTAACAALTTLAFVGGRYWERHFTRTQQIAGGSTTPSTQRVVLVVLTDHLDRTERLLVALDHADASDPAENSQLQSEARELLASNRLYRSTANETGDPALARTLERVEGVLAEVANNPNLSTADLARLREEMNTEGILFEIRVLLSRTPESTNSLNHAKGASI